MRQRTVSYTNKRQFIQGLQLWPEVGGLDLGIGPTGVGKSIAVRRFLLDLDESRFWVLRFTQVPSTPSGFLR